MGKKLVKLTYGVVTIPVMGVSSFFGYHYYKDLNKPSPYDFAGNKGKPK